MLKKTLAATKKDVLVAIVKMVQQRRMEGSEGCWEDFLNLHDRKFGASLSDPRRRSADDMVSFLETFTEEADIMFLERVLQYHLNREASILELNKDGTIDHEKLVLLTYVHPEYAPSFFFSSYDEDWVVTSTGNMSRSNKMLAVDCEMVKCEDGTEPAVKVCVVDEYLEVKLDKLVNPYKPVEDYKTEFTGITAKDLEGVTCSLADIQKSMKKLLSHGTILIGHSLHCDLKALKLDHARVIDTSLIFKRADGKRPSLSQVCKAVLKHDVREEGAEHNCLDDAGAAMKLVLAKLRTGFDELIKRDDLSKQLLLHRIPVCVSNEELRAIFLEDSAVVLKPGYKEKGKPYYSANAIFKDQHEADDTFRSIEGVEEEDRNGLRQKLISVHLKNGSSARFYIRKMVRDDDSHVLDSSRKRQIEVEPSKEECNYKLKKNSDDSDHAPIMQNFSGSLFRVEKYWFLEDSFYRVMTFWWNRFQFVGSASFIFAKKLQSLKPILKDWSRSKFKCLDSKLTACEQGIMRLDGNEEVALATDKFKERTLAGNHKDVAHIFYQKCQSRAEVDLVGKGERNTSYFHVVANGRKKANWIHKIIVENEEITSQARIEEEAKKFFFTLYREDHTWRPKLDNLQFPTISEQQRTSLETQIEEKEVLEVISHLASNKSPGPDGMPNEFYKAT
ncbi:hypothetical protein MKW94_014019 [Papaver nudicaule]|uniref:Exonuclease domain-containing protein n=1 Tax=Papaver nudicaule TaxID=74823 RepID=A0AA41W1X7_PAPNU|nr:hypothetical protein [Papaver nudicaule]